MRDVNTRAVISSTVSSEISSAEESEDEVTREKIKSSPLKKHVLSNSVAGPPNKRAANSYPRHGDRSSRFR